MNRSIDDSQVYEKHHIVPRSLGGNNTHSNLIRLTPREHFIAHWLLWRIHQNQQMAFAFYALCKFSSTGKNISSRTYEEAKLARRPYIKQNNTKKRGTTLTTETRNKIQKSLLGREITWNDKISAALKDRPKTPSHKKAIADSLTGITWSISRNKNISIKNSGANNGRAKKVQLIDPIESMHLATFDTMKYALAYLNSNRVNKVSKTTFYRKIVNAIPVDGFIWKFA